MTSAEYSPVAVDTNCFSHNDLEPDTRSTDELEDEISELSTHIDAATYRLLRAIAEFDRREAWGWGFESTAHWLTWRVGIDMVTAREKVRVARALESLPLISDTFRQGKVSYSKVRAMTRVATSENEGYLLYIAENGTASDVESLVRAYRRASRGEATEDARRQREERYLDMYTDEDGMVVIRGRLPQEVAVLVEKALQAAMDALREEERSNDDSAESSATSVIPAEAGIPHPRIDVSLSDDSAESRRLEDFPQRRADALGLLAEAALGQGLDGTERGEPYQVMVHVDADVLADQSPEGRSELGNGEGISAESCRRLACDAPHLTGGQDAEGNVLHMGRKTRRISKPLWRALISRDRTCRFPGCDRTKHLQAHHIDHWAKGGETTPDNLVLLCRAHHWTVHEGGGRIEPRPPLGHTFHRPDGTPLPICPTPLPIHGEAGDTLKESNRRYGLEITAHTVDCLWDGERMDLHMAVDALLTYDAAD